MRNILFQALSEIRSAWRFRWYGAAVAWFVALAGWGWVALQPDVYEASTRVYVDMTSVLSPLLENQIVASDVSTRLAYVTGHARATVFGTSSGDRYRHFATTPKEREGVIEDLGDAIRIDATPASRDSQGRESPSSIFSISYRHAKPATATGVVTAFLNSLIEDTLGANREGTDTAERFLEERIHEYENRLQQAEQALADFPEEELRPPAGIGRRVLRTDATGNATSSMQLNGICVSRNRDATGCKSNSAAKRPLQRVTARKRGSLRQTVSTRGFATTARSSTGCCSSIRIGIRT